MAKRSRRLPNSKRSAPITRFIKFGSFQNIKDTSKNAIRKAGNLIDRKPLTSFFAVLLLLFALIAAGSFLRKPKAITEIAVPAKTVSTYSIGSSPTIKVQAQIEKSGIIKIVALTPGVVSFVNVFEGQEVLKGTTLVGLSSNYQGGNAASVQRELAFATYKNTKDTYDLQKELIKKQREIADKTDANADQLRDITSKSLDETRSLLNLNQGIVSTLNTTLQDLESGNVGGANDAQILQTKQIISQFQSAVSQLQSGLRSAEFQAAGDKPPADLSNLSREAAQKQLDIQEKALSLSLEASSLSLKLAQILEATMYPAAPFDGVIERVYVTPGESVNPGTPLVVIHGAQTLKAIAKVPRDIAQKLSPIDIATITFDDTEYSSAPLYISTEATDGSLYSAIFNIPSDFQNSVSDNEYVIVELPVGMPSTTTSVPFIPIDAVYQSADESYVFIVKNGKAESKKVTLGPIVGSYVQVESGLLKNDEIILTRSVVNGKKKKKR